MPNCRPVRLLLLALLLAGCGGSHPQLETLPTQEGDWLRAKRSFDEGQHLRAVETLGAFVEKHPGSNRLDEALLLLGLSHMEIRENLLAVEDFNRLIRDFPQSPHRERAEFERARSYYQEVRSPAKDPEPTETARDYFRAYLLRYPEGAYVGEATESLNHCLELLARKALLNAQTYLRLKHDRAAVIYLEKALRIKPDYSRAGETLAELARARERLGEEAEAREAWERLLEYAIPDRTAGDAELERLRQEALEALRRLPELTKGGDSP
jgi:outer membrane protein assembly factor BamD